ncbi:MAG: putative viral replication protein [Circoviridae sp.]|nr:MAG: putative viral replication protein [Circoviridae sp.]
MSPKSVPAVPACSGGGNTITPPPLSKISPAKRWCFTLNNYSDMQFCSICSTIESKCSIGIIGKEIGESGTPHLQGYLEFKSKTRPFSHFKDNKIHWEKSKGSRQDNLDYCSKDGDVWRHGIDAPYELSIAKFYPWQKDVLDTIQKEANDRTINWIWESNGCAGKTTFCKYIFMNYDKVVVLSGKASDMKNCIIDYKNTNNCLPKIVLIDIPRSTNCDFLSYQGIEEIKNMFFYSGKYEGGMVCGKPPHMFVFANEEPNRAKCSEDRWNIKYIGHY